MTVCVVAGEEFVLLPERAVWWPAARTLLVADFHLGKAASFRRAGIPLPAGTTTENVDRLERAVAATGAGELVFLGDFLHSAEGRARNRRILLLRQQTPAHPKAERVHPRRRAMYGTIAKVRSNPDTCQPAQVIPPGTPCYGWE